MRSKKVNYRFNLLIWLVITIASLITILSVDSSYKTNFTLKGSESAVGGEIMKSEFLDSEKTLNAYTGYVYIKTDKEKLSNVTNMVVEGRLQEILKKSDFLSGYTKTIKVQPIEFQVAFRVVPDKVLAENINKLKASLAPLNNSLTKVEFSKEKIQSSKNSGVKKVEKTSYGEIIGVIFAFILLLAIMRNFFTAILPIVVAGFTIVNSLALLKILTHLFSIAYFAEQLSTLIGLGIAIDYSLLMVMRYVRRRKESDRDDALNYSRGNAGRSIIIAGAIVGLSILSMNLLGIPLLNGVSFAVSGVILIAVLASITLTPALISSFGKFIDKPNSSKISEYKSVGSSKRDLVSVVSVTLIAVILSLPLGKLNLYSESGVGSPDENPIYIVIKTSSPADVQATSTIKDRLQTDKKITNTQILERRSGDKEYNLLSITPIYGPEDYRSQKIIERIRERYTSVDLPYINTRIEVAGASASILDMREKILDRYPFFLFMLLIISSILIFLLYSTITIPLLTSFANVLSLGATIGVTSLIFSNSKVTSILGVSSGPIEPFLLVIGTAILFGLSMDYQIFLLSSIKEESLRGKEIKDAVSYGLSHTKNVITAAALIMISIFLSFLFGGEKIIKEFGFALAFAVAFDAFIVRILLMPAAIRLLGGKAWYLPKFLKFENKIFSHKNLDLGE